MLGALDIALVGMLERGADGVEGGCEGLIFVGLLLWALLEDGCA